MSKPSFQKNVFQTASIMMVLTLISKLLGFIREIVIASNFGTSFVVDAYVLAQNIPTVLFGGILSAIGVSFTPMFSGVLEKEGEEAGNRFANEILNLTMLIGGIVFFIGVAISDQLADLFASGFSEEAVALTASFLKITFSYAIFSAATTIFNAFLQYNGRFFSPVLAGYLLNIGIIVVAIVSARTNHYFLATGALLGHFLNFLLVGFAAKRIGYHHKAVLSFRGPVRQTIRLAFPVFLSSSLYAINTFVDKTLAASLSEGTVAALNYGYLLVTLITGLTSTVIATILYPKMVQFANQGDLAEYNQTTKNGMSLLLVIAIPIGLGGIAFAPEIVQIVYERGAFDTVSTTLTADAFRLYGLGLVFLSINELLSRTYYSLKDMKTPIACSAVSIAVNIALNLLLIRSLEHRGLAFATALSAAVNSFAMLFFLKKKHTDLSIYPPAEKILRITISAIVAVGGALVVYQLLQVIWLPRILYLGAAVLFAVALYVLLLTIMKIEEVELLKIICNPSSDNEKI